MTNKLYWVLFSIFATLALAPIWLTSYAPLPDDAVHLASASIWAHLHDPQYHLGEYYDLRLGLAPYWGYYLLVRIFAVVVGLVNANRIVLSLYALGLVLGMQRLADRFGHSRIVTLGAFALVGTFSFNDGFIHCCLSFALVPWALASFDAFCEQPTWKRGVATFALGCAIWLNHVLGWGLFLGAGGLIGLMHRGRDLRSLALRAAVWASVLAAGIVASLCGQGKGMGAGVKHAAFSGRNPPLELARMFMDNVWNLCEHHESQWAGGVFLVAVGALIVTAQWKRELHTWRAIAFFATAIGAYFILPRSVLAPAYIWGVSFRYAAMAALGLVLCVPGDLRGARLALVAVMGLATAAIQIDLWMHWTRSSAFVAGFDDVVRVPPVGSNVLFIVRKPWRDESAAISYVNPYSWYQVQKGGFNPWNFEDGFPIGYRKKLPSPDWRNPVFDWNKEGDAYDYVVGFNAPNAVSPNPRAHQVLAKDRWTVWQIDKR